LSQPGNDRINGNCKKPGEQQVKQKTREQGKGPGHHLKYQNPNKDEKD
jgi:hypothetical protein